MFTLIVLLTHTTLGTYPTQARCEAAVRHIYEQKLDPYRQLPKDVLKSLIDDQMRYVAPTEYLCQKN